VSMVNYHWSRISEQVPFCTTAPCGKALIIEIVAGPNLRPMTRKKASFLWWRRRIDAWVGVHRHYLSNLLRHCNLLGVARPNFRQNRLTTTLSGVLNTF